MPLIRYAAALSAAAMTLTACGHTAPSTHPRTGASRPAIQQSTIATARGKIVPIYRTAGGAVEMRLRNPNPDGAPRVFLAVGSRPGWWQVLLPTPPNGSSGWVRAADVTTSTTMYRLTVDLSAHRLRVYRDGRLLVDTPAAIGTADTPTPGGQYYLTELLRTPDPGGPYGPYAYGLSGRSETLTRFAGHDPVIGIHGTNQPGMLGRSVSHGCIRVSNSVIRRLAGMLPLGTPVQITA